ncbi:hypothetical protein TNCV_3577551 [Trichonephila clavipes]|uniref:Uncharacterized protein n=1 Tax=Trichonephila clavipes TaxID=2585209 RepID=A0A8X6RC44_TRICX|nr:hypothetical protein TNCV_3577551 [Trichonephila clavipes]
MVDIIPSFVAPGSSFPHIYGLRSRCLIPPKPNRIGFCNQRHKGLCKTMIPKKLCFSLDDIYRKKCRMFIGNFWKRRLSVRCKFSIFYCTEFVGLYVSDLEIC